jgi:hypothetical protein
VGVALDDPVGTWAAFDASPLVGAPIPDGVPRLGESIPLQIYKRAGADRLQAGHRHDPAARDPAGATFEVGLDGGSIGTRFQYAFGDGLAVAYGAGRDSPQLVADGGPTTGPPPLMNVLGHARKALGPGDHAVEFVHRLEDGLEQHLGDRIRFGYRLCR